MQAKLTLQRRSTASARVTVALHVADNRTKPFKEQCSIWRQKFNSHQPIRSERPEAEFSATATLWQVLTHFATNFQLDFLSRTNEKQLWLAPKLTILNRPFAGLDTLLATSLQSAGISTGRNLIRIASFEPSDLSLEQLNERVARAAEPAAKKPRSQAPDDSSNDTAATTTGPSDAVIAAFAAGEKEAAAAKAAAAEREAAVAQEKAKQKEEEAAAAVAAAAAAAAAATKAAVADVSTPVTSEASVEPILDPSTHVPIQFDAAVPIERNLRVLGVRALQSAAQRDAEVLPDSFYDVTPEDLKAVQASAQKRKQQSEQLMTREMRDRDKKRYLKTKIRVKMPDRIEIEGTFSVLETLGDVKAFVREQLRDAALPFYLFVTPPRTVLNEDDLTLGELELVPAALVLLAFGTPRAAQQVEQPFLKAELLANITEADYVDLTTLAVAEVEEQRATPVTANERIRSILSKLRKDKPPAAAAAANDDDDNDVDDKAPASDKTTSKVPKWLKLNNKKK